MANTTAPIVGTVLKPLIWRRFSSCDLGCYSGAERFADGREPLIGYCRMTFPDGGEVDLTVTISQEGAQADWQVSDDSVRWSTAPVTEAANVMFRLAGRTCIDYDELRGMGFGQEIAG